MVSLGEKKMKRLWTTFRYTYSRMRGQIIGWGLGLAVLGLIIVPFYDIFGEQQEQLLEMIASYPPEFLAFFGADATSVLTPAGYLKMYAFSMLPVIIGIFAVLAGSGLIVSDEERGRLDLIVTHPVGRSSFFFGRFLGLFSAAVSILMIGWLGFCVLLGNSSLSFTWGQLAVPFLSLLVQILIYAALALMLSMFLPTRNLAAMITGAVLVISYFMSSLAFMDERLETVAKFLPHNYYQIVLSLQELNQNWLLALMGISAVMVLLAWWRFVRRDIRLSGEGSWQLPFISKKQKTV
jgi:ABC-2 type transport system permease protein